MAVQTATFEKTIRTLLDEKKYQTVKDILVTMEPADIAAVFDDFGEERMALLFRLLPKETAAETFAELESENQELLIRGFSDQLIYKVDVLSLGRINSLAAEHFNCGENCVTCFVSFDDSVNVALCCESEGRSFVSFVVSNTLSFVCTVELVAL